MTFGVKFILLLNLALNVTILTLTTGSLCFGVKSMALATYPWQCAMMAFALAGVPIIVMAFSGVVHRNEAQIRIYLYYMWMLVVIFAVLLVKHFIVSGACENLPDFVEGQAWTCGVARVIHIAIVFISVSMICYFQHVVHSHCEDLAECGGGPDLSDLKLNKDFYSKKHLTQNPYSSLEAVAENGQSGNWLMGSMMGPTSSMGGSRPIFGGRHHEIAYPL